MIKFDPGKEYQTIGEKRYYRAVFFIIGFIFTFTLIAFVWSVIYG